MRYIASADAGNLGYFPLSPRNIAIEPVTQFNDQSFLVGQTFLYRQIHFADHFPVADLFQQILIFTDNIHQR